MDHGAHDKHAGHDPEVFKRKFWITLILAIPVIIWAQPIQDWFHYTAPEFPGSDLIPPLFSTVIFFYGGEVFLRGMVVELRNRQPGMMTLVSLAITVAYVYSIATEFGFPGEPLYWEVATLIVAMQLGHWIEMRAVQQAGSAVDELAKLIPDTAERIVDDEITEVPVAELEPGDLVLVRPGAQLPADGEVESGRSGVNESMLTGESRPVDKEPGSPIIGGTVNGQGSLRVRITKVGDETTLSGVMRIVADAQASQTKTQLLADRAAFWLTVIAITVGAITLIAWLISPESVAFAITRTVTVLVIACPHALGVAIPLVVAISTTLSANHGFLIRNRPALEQAREIDTVIFDKTGTLTTGRFGVTDMMTTGSIDDREALKLAAAAEMDSEHPIAKAIVDEAAGTGDSGYTATEFSAITGQGVQATVNGRQIAVGGPRLLQSFDQSPDQALVEAARQWGSDGKTVIYLFIEERPVAVFGIADVVREESQEAIDQLHRQGLKVVMITGDSEDVASSVSRELGIDEYYAEVLPGSKADRVKELQDQGRKVVMVGDGVNDAPALVTADVGVAIGAGTDVAIESADIILVRDDPRDIPRLVKLSEASYSKMRQNLAWATGYNVVAIPLAAGVLAPFGILLAPAVGALLMSVSTVIVAANAQLLRRVNLDTV